MHQKYQRDRQRDRQTDIVITILRIPLVDEVIIFIGKALNHYKFTVLFSNLIHLYMYVVCN